MQNSGRKAMSNNSMRQFANKAGTLVAKNPFWVLVIGSVGIHAIFVMIPVAPTKKAVEPPPLMEVKTATLPVVKLPPQSNRNLNRDLTNRLPRNTPNISNVSKSIFDSLFVQSSTNKLIPPSNVPPNSFPNSFSNSVPSPFELNSIERMDGFPPLMELPDVPLPPTNFEIDPAREFVKPRTSTPLPLQQSRTNALGQIDNSNPVKTTSNSNLRPEFQNNNGLRDTPIVPPSDSRNTKNADTSPKSPQPPVSQNPPTNQPPTQPTNQPPSQPINQQPIQSSIPSNIKQIDSIRSIYTNARITDLLTQELLEQTKIVPNPKEANVSRISGGIEDIEWIPARGNVAGKKGIVTFLWLVDPTGKIEFQGYTLEGDRDLVEIVAQAAKDYRFKPTEGSRKYRFVTAKYEFPAR